MTLEAQKPTTTEEVGGMGHSKKRIEDPRFIRGQGEYIEDVVLPNMVWMDIVRSPYAHATIKSIDATGLVVETDEGRIRFELPPFGR